MSSLLLKMLIYLQLGWGLVSIFDELVGPHIYVAHGVLTLCISLSIIFLNIKRIDQFAFIVLYFLMIPLISWQYSEIEVSLVTNEFVRRLTPFIIAFAIFQSRHVFKREEVEGFHVTFISISLIIQAFFAWSYFVGEIYMVDYHYGYARYTGSFTGPHQAGFYLLLNAISLLYVINFMKGSFLAKVLLYADLLLVVSLLHLTGTRTVIVGLLVYLLYSMLTYSGRHQKMHKVILVTLLFMALRLVADLFVDIPIYLQGGTSLVEVGGGRLVIWLSNIQQLAQQSFLSLAFGSSFGSDYVFRLGTRFIGSHSDYLTMLFEVGIVGFIIHMGYFLKYLLTISHFSSTVEYRWLRWIVGLILVAIITNVISNSFYTRVFPSTMLWMWTAIGLSVIRGKKQIDHVRFCTMHSVSE